MKKNIFIVFIIGIFLLGGFTTTGLKITSDEEKTNNENNYDLRPIMKADSETLKKWQEEYYNAEEAFIDPNLEQQIQTTESFSILDHLDYVPSERDQGWCSNCWAWPATAVVGIALYVQENIFERLSVQYINSCGSKVGIGCCEAGSLDGFVKFYRYTDKAIPWSNTNAHWQDNRAQCNTPCDSISTTPNYPISSISTKRIETHEIPESETISNVKNILHQEKGVYFSWILPDMEYRTDFSDFWGNKNEDYVYDLDWACGHEYLEDEGGGHAVLCVGYNDEEGTDNDYWIMLNSWGTPSSRPNGLFRANMHMNYDCTNDYQGHTYYTFGFRTLNITFESVEGAPNPPVIDGPESGSANTMYSYQISAVDPQGEDVYFYVDWGDGSTEGWLGPVDSGEEMEISHTWSSRGDFAVSVKAKDTNDLESLWSTLGVTMPKNRVVKTPLFDFLQKYPLLLRLLEQLLTI